MVSWRKRVGAAVWRVARTDAWGLGRLRDHGGKGRKGPGRMCAEIQAKEFRLYSSGQWL